MLQLFLFLIGFKVVSKVVSWLIKGNSRMLELSLRPFFGHHINLYVVGVYYCAFKT